MKTSIVLEAHRPGSAAPGWRSRARRQAECGKAAREGRLLVLRNDGAGLELPHHGHSVRPGRKPAPEAPRMAGAAAGNRGPVRRGLRPLPSAGAPLCAPGRGARLSFVCRPFEDHPCGHETERRSFPSCAAGASKSTCTLHPVQGSDSGRDGETAPRPRPPTKASCRCPCSLP